LSPPGGQSVALDPNATYEAAEVALIVFHVGVRTFRRRLARLRGEGFPGPISHWGRQVWSGQALIAWQNRGQLPDNVLPISTLLARNARQAARVGARRQN
jgi:hypothetical protein